MVGWRDTGSGDEDWMGTGGLLPRSEVGDSESSESSADGGGGADGEGALQLACPAVLVLL